MMATATGTIAALFTTVAYVPQLIIRKCWSTGKADDSSFRIFALLAAGIGLWAAHGVLRQDIVIIAANSVSLCLLSCILYLLHRAVVWVILADFDRLFAVVFIERCGHVWATRLRCPSCPQ
jgi:MtN3 and saliva related transmembrane protein